MSAHVTSSVLDELAAVAEERDAAAEKLQCSVLTANESGVSQRDIAKTLGVTQSAVSQMIATSRARAKLRQGPVGRKLAEHRAEVIRIARSHGASNVRVFGSVSRGEDDEDSDLDLLVNMPGLRRLTEVIGLEYDLTDVLGAPVDVTPEQLVKREALPLLGATAVPL